VKPTKDIILEWLKYRAHLDSEFGSHEVEMFLPDYGKIRFDTIRNPATYSRIFRQMRANGLAREGIYLTRLPGSKEARWKVSIVS
jgi:hypothetical protein